MNSNSIFTRRHAGADAAASVSAPATTSAAAEDAFKNDPTATLEGVRGKDVTKAAKALLKDSVKHGGDFWAIIACRPTAILQSRGLSRHWE